MQGSGDKLSDLISPPPFYLPSPAVRHAGLDPWFDRPFDKPFDKLMVLSNVEGLTTLSKPVESLKVERVEGASSSAAI